MSIHIHDCVDDTPIVSAGCMNPIEYLFSEASIKASEDSTDLLTAMTALLSSGIVSSNHSKFCCPDCTSKYSYYYFGNVTGLTSIMTTLGQNTTNPSCALPCCINFQGNISASASFNTTVKVNPGCCDNNFVPAVKDLLASVHSPSALLSAGIVEVSGIAYETGVDIILTLAKKYLKTNDKTIIGTFIAGLMSDGLCIKCFDCGIIIASTTSFDSWLVANHYNDSICL